MLDSAPAFGMLHQGTLPFAGREGARLWTQLVDVVAERWDEVVDALDEVVRTPEVDAAALADGGEGDGRAAVRGRRRRRGVRRRRHGEDEDEDSADTADGPAHALPDSAPTFWEEVGIDPIRIITGAGEYLSLRCYLDDKPVFLGSGGKIDVFPTEPRAHPLDRRRRGRGRRRTP